MILSLLIIPFGSILSLLSTWVKETREKLLRPGRRYPDAAVEPKIFGFADSNSLPLPENLACREAEEKLSRGDFEGAKLTLVRAWLELQDDRENQTARLRLKDGFLELYKASGDEDRALVISKMPLLVLDNEVQWIVTHPDEQIGACELFKAYEENCPAESNKDKLE